ncbi:MAG: cupin-like domain-containing protein [Bacteriovorax sp.]|nr:cupin-like domain-containing protein [Bacteriovorax sp.]
MKVITEITRVSQPSVKEFMNEFVYPKRPVIITGGLDMWKAKDWDLQILKEKIGKKEFSFRSEEGTKTAIFSEMIDQITNSNPLSPAPYLRNMDLLKMFPELRDDVFPNISYMKNNWRDHWMWPKNWPEHVGQDLIELFISAKGVAFPKLHIDYWGMDGFIAQLHGSKEFILYSPEDSAYLYPSIDNPLVSTVTDFINPDFHKFPELAKATQYRFELKAGDLLYNPRWWHTTKTLETSITIIMAYWHRENYPVFLDEIKRAYKDCNKIKTYTKVNYFKGLGLMLAKSR